MAFGALALTNCKEDLAPAKALWDAAENEYSTQLSKCKSQHAEILKAMQQASLPTGADLALTSAHKSLEAAMQSQSKSLVSLETAFANTKANVLNAHASGKLTNLQSAIELAKTDLGPAFHHFNQNLARNSQAVQSFQSQVKAFASRAVTEPALFEQRAETLKKEGGSVDLNDIEFKPGSQAIDTSQPSSKETLSKLVTFANSCKDMELAITGHASADGDSDQSMTLGKKRADAVKQYLEKQKVSAKVIRTEGKSDLDNASMPKPSSRNLPQNPQITLEVVKPCAR